MSASEIDKPRAAPEKYEFTVSGHQKKYSLTSLLPYYGSSFCDRLASAWRLCSFQKETSTYKAFQAGRTFFYVLAMDGLVAPHSAAGRLFEGFRDQPQFLPSVRDWDTFIRQAEDSICDIKSSKWRKSGSTPRSRNSLIDSVRAGLKVLNQEGIVPEKLPSRRVSELGEEPMKCLATLFYEAGRLDLSGKSPREAAEAFGHCNRELLEQIREEHVRNLRVAVEKFDEGQRILQDKTLPDTKKIVATILRYSRDSIKEWFSDENLTAYRDRLFSIAIKIYQYYHNSKLGETARIKLISFIKTVSSTVELQPYVEGTIEALGAAYRIVEIDTALNPQTNEEIAFDTYVGEARRGQRRVQTCQMAKNRAMGKMVSGHLLDDMPTLSARSSGDRLSGVGAVELWRKISAPMRKSTGPSSERLWIWRRHDQNAVRTNLKYVAHHYLGLFMAKHASNPQFGGLHLTSQIIRRSVANSKITNADFNYAAVKTLLGHTSPSMPFQYMSESALKAFLNSQIREFLDAWEAVSVSTIEDAARMLGVPEDELKRRVQLGLDSGLSFAQINSNGTPKKILEEGLSLSQLPASKFNIGGDALKKLELARRALWAQFEKMACSNPLRFVRTWIPWMAIVEGYCEKLLASRFRQRFQKARDEVSALLDAGSIRLPVLW